MQNLATDLENFIVLDFDGVINSATYIRQAPKDRRIEFKCENPYQEGFAIPIGRAYIEDALAVDPAVIARLNKIVQETGAKVVVSSSWRIFYNIDGLREILHYNGFVGDVVDHTPRLIGMSCRGDEIQEWLDCNGGCDSFVILDDDDDMGHLSHKLVLTDFEVGLTDADMQKAIKILKVHDGNRMDRH